MGKMLKTQDLKLARIKYYDSEHNGAELTEIEAYAILRKMGPVYVNVFDSTEDLPVLERTVYSNYTKNGEPFGNRLILAWGELADGPCYVIEPTTVKELFRGRNTVSYEELKDFVLRSPLFFVDRLKLIQGEKSDRRRKMKKLIASDVAKMEELEAYINGHGAKKYYKEY